ncbi:MAG: hypothetical protein ACYDD4_08220 [Acidimicrobiales bacterium]
MDIRRWFMVMATAGALVAGGGLALVNAPGITAPTAARSPVPMPSTVSVSHQLQLMLVEESALTAQIDTVRQQLAQAATAEQAKIASADQAISSRESQLAQQESELAAQQSTIRQEAAQLQAEAQAQTVAGAGRSSGGGGDGGGGGDD